MVYVTGCSLSIEDLKSQWLSSLLLTARSHLFQHFSLVLLPLRVIFFQTTTGVHVCSGKHACVCVCVHIHEGQYPQVSFFRVLTTSGYFKRQALSVRVLLIQLHWLGSETEESHCLCSLPQCWVLSACTIKPGFFIGAENSKPGPHTHMKSSLLTWLSYLPSLYILLLKKFKSQTITKEEINIWKMSN